MLEVKVDMAGFEAKIRRMIYRIDHFKRVDIGTELSAWQTEDLHRHRPFTMRSRRAGKAATLIRPHSRFEVNRSRYAQRRFARKTRRKTYVGPTEYRKWSTREILRQDMHDRLVERMNAALGKLLTWK